MFVDAYGHPIKRDASQNVADLTRGSFVGQFNRTQGDIATRAHHASMNVTTAMCLSVWIYAGVDPVSVPVFICKGNVNTAFLMLISANKVIGRVIIGGVTKDAADTVDLVRGSWQSFRLTYNNTNLILQRGGSTVATTAASGSIDTNANPFRIGCSELPTTNPYRGGLYDVRLWSTATPGDSLSAALTGSETNLIANWVFSEGKGPVVNDIGPNALHLACNSDMWTDRIGRPY
jgi:hypothetical protein